MAYKYFTSEAVGVGHPDKICDQIADLILDECLKQDKNSRVACEVMVSNKLIVIAGEITTKAYVDFIKCAWHVLKPLGYNENDFIIISNINSQSSDIAKSVNKKNGSFGAGDQGIVYGYATNETKEYLPWSYVLANEILKEIELCRKNKTIKWLKSDMKSQVTLSYTQDKKVVIDNVVVSVEHDKDVSQKTIEDTINIIIDRVFRNRKINLNFKRFINPSGSFTIGGPKGDTGVTGRKIMVDTYGGISHHGGGAFSGKDYTKVDRTGAYYARYIAKNIVAAKLADVCEVQLSFAIGKNKPTAISINTYNTNYLSEAKIQKIVEKVFDFELKNIVKELNLLDTPYFALSTFGHFGRDEKKFYWEKTDKVNRIKLETFK